jgi:hypothetical protein
VGWVHGVQPHNCKGALHVLQVASDADGAAIAPPGHLCTVLEKLIQCQGSAVQTLACAA